MKSDMQIMDVGDFNLYHRILYERIAMPRQTVFGKKKYAKAVLKIKSVNRIEMPSYKQLYVQ